MGDANLRLPFTITYNRTRS